jgi:hypothetical protein
VILPWSIGAQNRGHNLVESCCSNSPHMKLKTKIEKNLVFKEVIIIDNVLLMLTLPS